MELINTLSNNSVIGAFVAGVAVLMCVSLFKWINRRFCKAPKVFKTLETGLEKHNCKFLPTTYLASETNYTVSEVEILCTMHPKIIRNKKQLESWCIK
jgi:hypothetical protein